MFFSSAPLDSVASVQVFTCEQNKLCRGILFRYNDGEQRAVGQCRIHVDPCETVIKPSALYFQHTVYESPSKRSRRPSGVRVRFRSNGVLELENNDWEYTPFDSGQILDLWFTDEDYYMSLRSQEG